MITCTIHGDRTYYETVHRGVRYIAYGSATGWQVMSARLSLGRGHIPGVKRFASVEEVSARVKALEGLDRLIPIGETLPN